jgi:hypothetical protein
MAYVSTVTKYSVVKRKDDNYQVSIHVSIMDDSNSSIVLEKIYSIRYSNEWSIGDIKNKFQKLIQADWDKFIGEQSLFNNAAFGIMVGEIKTALDTYTN